MLNHYEIDNDKSNYSSILSAYIFVNLVKDSISFYEN